MKEVVQKQFIINVVFNSVAFSQKIKITPIPHAVQIHCVVYLFVPFFLPVLFSLTPGCVSVKFGWFIGEHPDILQASSLVFLFRWVATVVSFCLAVSCASGMDSLQYFAGSSFLLLPFYRIWRKKPGLIIIFMIPMMCRQNLRDCGYDGPASLHTP